MMMLGSHLVEIVALLWCLHDSTLPKRISIFWDRGSWAPAFHSQVQIYFVFQTLKYDTVCPDNKIISPACWKEWCRSNGGRFPASFSYDSIESWFWHLDMFILLTYEHNYDTVLLLSAFSTSYAASYYLFYHGTNGSSSSPSFVGISTSVDWIGVPIKPFVPKRFWTNVIGFDKSTTPSGVFVRTGRWT